MIWGLLLFPDLTSRWCYYSINLISRCWLEAEGKKRQNQVRFSGFILLNGLLIYSLTYFVLNLNPASSSEKPVNCCFKRCWCRFICTYLTPPQIISPIKAHNVPFLLKWCKNASSWLWESLQNVEKSKMWKFQLKLIICFVIRTKYDEVFEHVIHS